VAGKAVARVLPVEGAHQGIPGGLGQHGGRQVYRFEKKA
jgi:hypothetical protein